jgi:hypothetical protein
VGIGIVDSGAPPSLIQSAPLQADIWQDREHQEDPPTRDTAREYSAVTPLPDGDLAVVTPR